jgi:hypothetical protein
LHVAPPDELLEVLVEPPPPPPVLTDPPHAARSGAPAAPHATTSPSIASEAFEERTMDHLSIEEEDVGA